MFIFLESNGHQVVIKFILKILMCVKKYDFILIPLLIIILKFFKFLENRTYSLKFFII